MPGVNVCWPIYGGRSRELERARVLRRDALAFGIPAIDDALKVGGLKFGALHEVVEAGPAAGHAALASLFTAGMSLD